MQRVICGKNSNDGIQLRNISSMSPRVTRRGIFTLFIPITGMSGFSNRIAPWHVASISDSENTEGGSIFKIAGCENNLKSKKLGTQILKFWIMSIRITSTSTQIVSIWITLIQITLNWSTLTLITPISFLLNFQILIWSTFVHYKKYCHDIGILWTQQPVNFLIEHRCVIKCRWYI